MCTLKNGGFSLWPELAREVYKIIIFLQMSLVTSFFSLFTREYNETSIAGGEKALTCSLDFVNYFIYGNYNVSYYNAADQCIRLSPW